MKYGLARVVILCSLLFITNHTFADDIDFSALVGKWRAEKPHSSGAVVAVELEIKTDKTFSGIALINDVPKWTYDGTLVLKGNELTWTYLNSSKPMPPDYQDVDKILSIGKDKFTYKSSVSGEINSYARIKE
jgi:hypothetical protein